MMIPNKFNGYSGDGKRLYHKGGGDPGKAAQKQEAERQARITAATDVINNMFNGAKRSKLYAEQKQAVYDINKKDVERQYQEAERQNRFGLARSGLMGGSADVDSNALLQEKNNEGLIKATGIADQAAADLKTADERSRQSLISMAQSGIDTGTAQSMALRNLDATSQNALGVRAGASVGNLFDSLQQAYLNRQAAAGMKAGGMPGWQQSFGGLSPHHTESGNIT